jgi:hypothetical protein
MRLLFSVDDADLHSTAGTLGFDIGHRRLPNESDAAIVVRAFPRQDTFSEVCGLVISIRREFISLASDMDALRAAGSSC